MLCGEKNMIVSVWYNVLVTLLVVCVYVCVADIDECSDGFVECDSKATCVNLPGWYHCECRDGYRDNGMFAANGESCEGKGRGRSSMLNGPLSVSKMWYIYESLIRLTLSLYNPLKKSMGRLRWFRVLTGARKPEHITPFLRSLRLLPVSKHSNAASALFWNHYFLFIRFSFKLTYRIYINKPHKHATGSNNIKNGQRKEKEKGIFRGRDLIRLITSSILTFLRGYRIAQQLAWSTLIFHKE